MTIEKLIIDYSEKIEVCDKKLEDIKTAKQIARTANDADELIELSAERREWSARKQAYIQALSDIKSLADEI